MSHRVIRRDSRGRTDTAEVCALHLLDAERWGYEPDLYRVELAGDQLTALAAVLGPSRAVTVELPAGFGHIIALVTAQARHDRPAPDDPSGPAGPTVWW